MHITDREIIEKMMIALTDAGARKVLVSTVASPKSAAQLSEKLEIPIRSVYRHIADLCELGLLAGERTALIESGGKSILYRSLVKSVTFVYNSEEDNFDVNLIPNENILGKFMRFWSYMGAK